MDFPGFMTPVIQWINGMYPKSALTLLFVIGPVLLSLLMVTVRIVFCPMLSKRWAGVIIFALAAALTVGVHVKYTLGSFDQVLVGIGAVLLLGWLANMATTEMADFLASRWAALTSSNGQLPTDSGDQPPKQ